MVNSVSPGSEKSRLRIVFGDKLNHEPRREPFEESGKVREGLIAGKREVMNERECQHDIGRSTFKNGGTLLIEPPRRRARIEEIKDQWQ